MQHKFYVIFILGQTDRQGKRALFEERRIYSYPFRCHGVSVGVTMEISIIKPQKRKIEN